MLGGSGLIGEAFESCGFSFAVALPTGGDVGDDALVFRLAAFGGPRRGLQVSIKEGVRHGQVIGPVLQEEIVAELGEITALAVKWWWARPKPCAVIVQVVKAIGGRVEAGIAGEEVAVNEVVGVEALEFHAAAGEDVIPGLAVVCLQQFFDGGLRKFSADEEFMRVAAGAAPAACAEDWLWAEVVFAEHSRAGEENALATGGHYRPAEMAEHFAIFNDAVIFGAHILGVECPASGLMPGDRSAREVENDFGAWFLEPCVKIGKGREILPVGVYPAAPASRLEGCRGGHCGAVGACHVWGMAEIVIRAVAGYLRAARSQYKVVGGRCEHTGPRDMRCLSCLSH